MKHLTSYSLHSGTHCATYETRCIIYSNFITYYISTLNNIVAHFFNNTVSLMIHNESRRDTNTKRPSTHKSFITNKLTNALHSWHFICYISNINFYMIKFLKTIKGIAK